MIKIAHFSDLHIRNYTRHQEYRQALSNFYESLRANKPDAVVFTGDFCHLKTNISPELVQMCASVFADIANIAPFFVILGNHDCSVKDLNRLDALSPIVDALDNRNLFFYKDSGIYVHNDLGVNFIVYSCIDKQWPSNIASNGNINIGLYHGCVKGAQFQNGMIIQDGLTVKDFLKDVDYFMLGDIHKMQILDSKYRSAYPGSLLQQNYGESLNKGYLLWEIESKDKHEVDFIKLSNVCPFYTVNLSDTLEIPDLKLQPKSRIRIFSRQLSVVEKSVIKEKINHKYDPLRLDFIDEVSAHRQEIKIDSESAKIEDLYDENVQNKLLKKYFEPYNLDEYLMNRIYEINSKYSPHVKRSDDILRNVEYKLGKLTWSNMFSYKEANELDFSKYKGILGIFGKSGVGKSSAAIDIPLYCMFNKISKRVTKNDFVINENKENCGARLEIKLGDKTYHIDRQTDVYLKKGAKKGTPVYQGRTVVNFFATDKGGKVTSLNGLERSDTDMNIRKIFGTAEDFITTSASPQWKLLNLIEAGGTERQKLIGRYFDVDVFNKKHTLAKEELKEIKAILKSFDADIDLDKFKQDLQEKVDAEQKNLEIKNKVEKVSKNLRDLIQTLKDSIGNLPHNKSGLELKFDEIKLEIENQRNKLKKIKESASIALKLDAKLCEKQDELDLKELKAKDEEFVLILKDFNSKSQEISNVKYEIKSRKEDVLSFNQYKCLNNENCQMRKSCSEIEKKIQERALALSSLEVEAKKLADQLEKDGGRKSVAKKMQEWFGIEKKRIELAIAIKAQGEIDNVQDWIEFYKKELKEIELKIEECDKNKDKIAKVNGQIERCKQKLDQNEQKVREAVGASLTLAREVGAAKILYDSKKAAKAKYEALKRNFEAYDYYVKAMSKDGIVKQIIANNLGIINNEILKILSVEVGFTVVLESNKSGKAIDIYFKHKSGPKRHIELCSGMEKTLAEIAIRAALVNVTTLPRSNVFILDEAFGALDSEYMESLTGIFEYLKTLFETVVIITHMDQLKDVVDHVVEIERGEDGYARLN